MKVIICLDGFAPEYLAAGETPNLDAVARAGFHTIGLAIVPTVTNVNNTSIITARLPAAHGITTNYRLDPASGRETYMESAEELLAPTAFRHLADRGQTCCLLTAKDKLKGLIGDGAALAASAERPPAWLVARIGAAPGIYTIGVNHWLLRAARDILANERPDFLYVSTTDYVTHTHPPESEAALANVRETDRLIGELIDTLPDLELVVTADHGMNAKTRGIDPQAILAASGIAARAIPIIKDRHVVHHRNLGGAAYVYLADPACAEQAAAILRDEAGVEAVLDREAAAGRYDLHPGRIGDLFLLADRETVFGELSSPREPLCVRSHGSLHERQIPIYALGKGPLAEPPHGNSEIARWIFSDTAG